MCRNNYEGHMDNNGGVEMGGRWGGLGVRLGSGGKGRELYLNNNKIREKMSKKERVKKLIQDICQQ